MYKRQDLHKPEGAAIARRVAASADVVVENFKPGTMVKYLSLIHISEPTRPY